MANRYANPNWEIVQLILKLWNEHCTTNKPFPIPIYLNVKCYIFHRLILFIYAKSGNYYFSKMGIPIQIKCEFEYLRV